MSAPAHDVISVARAAEILGVKRQRVYLLIKQGRLKPVRVKIDTGERRPVYLSRRQVEALEYKAPAWRCPTCRRFRPAGAPCPECGHEPPNVRRDR